MGKYPLIATTLLFLFSACARSPQKVLRLATTTSTYDSGLLDEILPEFEETYQVRVEIFAVGTGQALKLAERGDVDVVLVHNKSFEEAFVEAGHGLARVPVMINDFILVGPKSDPAMIKGEVTATLALARIAEVGEVFASRGDDSGTHAREQFLWGEVGIDPERSNYPWYLSLGQGMGETLQFSNERGAYTLSDRATFVSMREVLPDLTVMVGGESSEQNRDQQLENPYSVIVVNQLTHPGVAQNLAEQFLDWLISVETQERIGRYGVDQFGQPLFFPHSGDVR